MKMPDECVYIYALKDPDTLIVRYVGKSNDAQARYYQHLHAIAYQTTPPITHWIQSLAVEGKQPILEILEEVEVSTGDLKEIKWIKYYASETLLNVIHSAPSRRSNSRLRSPNQFENPRSIRFEPADEERIAALAKLWRCSEAAAVRRAIAIAAKQEGIP